MLRSEVNQIFLFFQKIETDYIQKPEFDPINFKWYICLNMQFSVITGFCTLRFPLKTYPLLHAVEVHLCSAQPWSFVNNYWSEQGKKCFETKWLPRTKVHSAISTGFSSPHIWGGKYTKRLLQPLTIGWLCDEHKGLNKSVYFPSRRLQWCSSGCCHPL